METRRLLGSELAVRRAGDVERKRPPAQWLVVPHERRRESPLEPRESLLAQLLVLGDALHVLPLEEFGVESG